VGRCERQRRTGDCVGLEKESWSKRPGEHSVHDPAPPPGEYHPCGESTLKHPAAARASEYAGYSAVCRSERLAAAQGAERLLQQSPRQLVSLRQAGNWEWGIV
jgi:hypothetical protein